jgi:hypothetical protein
MQDEIRKAILKSFIMGFAVGGFTMVIVYSEIVIPLLKITN